MRGQDHREVPQRVPRGGPLEVHPALVQTCRIHTFQHIILYQLLIVDW